MATTKSRVEIKQVDGSESDLEESDAEMKSENSEISDEDASVSSAGNLGWANAMCQVLNAPVHTENFILSKAKKDSERKTKKKDEIELVDGSGNLLNKDKPEEKKVIKSFSQKRKEVLEKQKQKALWEAMCRVKPDITQREKERELVKIATRGVVHLFNTVHEHQKSTKVKKAKASKRSEKLNVVKGNFMDILKGYEKQDKLAQADPVLEKTKQEETWSILKDDFMMGAEMKDWDKESDDDK
ncbi:RRP15-like protein [Uloborus diversus]|uniref:RRP15-like protein n=1 Tax=Uloborus diversus TaxID=327109 RepID=UPI00240A645A|nr:RRP15-like protein [Uloborus diversus]XP_054716989.1 RRP15-like protein [Uloborus diversus]